MSNRSLRALLVGAALLAVQPVATVLAADPPAYAPRPESERLAEVFDWYFERQLELNPIMASSIGDPRYNDRFEVSISPAWMAKSEAIDREALVRIATIDPAKLSGQDLLSYEIFKTGRERDLEGLRFPTHLVPVNQFFSTPNFFAQLGSGASLHPFRTTRDYEDFLKRIDGYVAWTDQAIVNMREGIAKGVMPPKVLMERTLPQLDAIAVVKPEDSVFWGPIKGFPEAVPAADRERLTAAYRAAIGAKLLPAYRRLHDFVRDEYLPKSRDSYGMQGLPDGEAWYAYNVREITTTDYTPAQIHAIGLAEVERIHGEMRKVMQEVGFEGSLQDFFKYAKNDPRFIWDSREALVAGYLDIKRRVDPQLPKLFGLLPKADYEVRAVEPFREKSAAGGSYQAASEDGSRPGVFYANTYDLKARSKWAMESLSLHEGNPGHHFQISIQREQKNLPAFRRFGGYTAYSEGWGLYAESLGRELGMYTDPMQYYGMLEAELWRSIRLVVDTGLHSKGWTRQQVLDYMEQNSSAAEAVRVSEAERYMAIPGQALAYKIGQLKIRELRTRAERELGAKFDVRGFHDEVLKDGALPLDVLEAKVARWIAAQK
jgi:uncharacterized protein (DUF885 family)